MLAQQGLVTHLDGKGDHQDAANRMGRLGLDGQVGPVVQGLHVALNEGADGACQKGRADPAVLRAQAHRQCRQFLGAFDVACRGFEKGEEEQGGRVVRIERMGAA